MQVENFTARVERHIEFIAGLYAPYFGVEPKELAQRIRVVLWKKEFNALLARERSVEEAIIAMTRSVAFKAGANLKREIKRVGVQVGDEESYEFIMGQLVAATPLELIDLNQIEIETWIKENQPDWREALAETREDAIWVRRRGDVNRLVGLSQKAGLYGTLIARRPDQLAVPVMSYGFDFETTDIMALRRMSKSAVYQQCSRFGDAVEKLAEKEFADFQK